MYNKQNIPYTQQSQCEQYPMYPSPAPQRPSGTMPLPPCGAPHMPGQMPGMMPQMPGMMPGMPHMPGMMPGMPQMPGMMPGMPQMPGMPPNGRVIPQPPAPGQLPLEMSYIENILRLNRGKLARVHMTFEGRREDNVRVFEGIIEAAGRDHIIISDPATERRYLLLMVYLDYVEFDEEIEYDYPFNTMPPIPMSGR